MFVAVFFMLLAGCAGKDIRQGFYQGIYEGVRVENIGHNTPLERANRPDMGYDQYSRERKEHIEEDMR
jgi:hypothetical protein